MTTEPVHSDNKDDQELAQALAGISNDAPAATENDSALNFEETPPSGPIAVSPFGDAPAPAADPVVSVAPAEPASLPTPSVSSAAPAADSPLENIKKDALNELRPLVDKLNVAPEEKFDAYLLLLRSTDDTALIGPAHDAAKEIPDEARRAQALLDVIKEIDYLTTQQ